MSQDQIAQFLQQGIAAARSNRPDIARGIFQQVVSVDPRNEVAWAWLASIARDNRERLIFLKQLWEINPQNEFAIKGLRALGIEPEPSAHQGPPGLPSATVPILEEGRYARVQQAADDFLRRYVPEPVDHLHVGWQKRAHGRYGEQGARRVRRLAYAAGTAAAVALVVFGVWIATQVSLPGQDDRQGRGIVSIYATETPIPSLTPTIGGPTPTAIPPGRLAFEPTRIPTEIEPGSPYGISSPTAIYPRPELNAERVVQNALDHFTIGDYDEAARILGAERERSMPDCYASVVYYEALSLAFDGDLDGAFEVLDWAQNYVPQRPHTSCQDSALIPAGLAEVFYLEDPTSEVALGFSQEALAKDRRLTDAVLTQARVQLARGNLTDAWQTVTQALEETPQDTNLLLLAGRVELASGQSLEALDYIGRALYIDPDLLAGLHLRAEAYLALAAQSTDEDRRLQAYGFAVQSAQLVQQYYEGDPLGYLLKAKAYLGEGKVDEAETALTRILAVEDQLPDRADAVVAEALRLRGEIYLSQGRYDRAVEDLETYVRRGGANDPEVVEQVLRAALRSGDLVSAEEWVARLVTIAPANRAYRLLQIRLEVELCTFNPGELACNYPRALTLLTDPFVAGLQTDLQRAEAFSLRAQARLRIVIQRGAALSQSQRDAELESALSDINRALNLRSGSVDLYYRGWILQLLDRSTQAFEDLQLVNYWNELYAYPFVDQEFNSNYAAAAKAVDEQVLQALVALQPTPTPILVPPQGTPEASPTPRAATATAEPTMTPRPQPTPTPAPVSTRSAPDVIP